MVLSIDHPAHVHHGKLAAHPQLLADFCPNVLIRSERRSIDGVGQDGKVLPAEDGSARFGAAGEAMGGSHGDQVLAQPPHRLLPAGGHGDCVGVGDADGNPRLFRRSQDYAAHVVQMAVDHPVGMVFEEVRQGLVVAAGGGVHGRDTINASPQSLDLVVKIRPEVPVDQEVELDLLPVHAAVIVHQHRLDAATTHIGHDL